MVLQREAKINLWGWADPSEAVRIEFNNKTYRTTAGPDRKWIIQLSGLKAGGPFRMEIIAGNRITLNDVFVGDVWICSGQSNMELSMERARPLYEADILRPENPHIRQFIVPDRYDFKQPQDDLPGGKWEPGNPETVLRFTAVGYFFARELYEKYQIPIGLINASLGGSPVEAWMSEEALEEFPHHLATAMEFRNDSLIQQIIKSDRDRIGSWYSLLHSRDKGLTPGATPWFDPSYDASKWPTMELPAFWDEQGMGAVNGVVWFRKEVEIPDAMIGKPAKLLLGRIVDADSAYINGQFVGTISYQYPPRRYDVAPTVLKPGKNVITVRVISNIGRGGFIKDKPYRLSAGGATIDLSGEWQYRLGATMEPLESQTFIRWKPLGLYNAMIAPLLNYVIKGVIWYQGESNTHNPLEYQKTFPALINDWRKNWDQGDFPFLYVQLANFMEAQDLPSESQWAELREAQLKSLRVPNTAMAVTIDIGEWNDIHPLNKKEVGKRLALAAQNVVYGDKNVVHSGPIYQSKKIEKDKIFLSFTNIGSGLVVMGKNELGHFAICGADRKFVWANAKIDGDNVVVWNDNISKPVAVRYAWADNPESANLYNKEGLAASPFRTDENFLNENNSPQKITKMVIDDLLSRTDFMMYVSDHCTAVHYAEACAGFGAARFAGLMNDSATIAKLAERYMNVIEDSIPNTANHVDANVYGILPLELYRHTKEEKFLAQGLSLAESQWNNPLPNGLTNQTRYWIDDVWMIGSLQVQAYRVTGKEIFLERAALAVDAYLQKLQQPNGLFFHGKDAPFFWGRGNGWVAAGLAELLSELPESNPHYPSILEGYKKMMNALLLYQVEDGMWWQLIDQEDSWKETSSTAMFGYAISTGVKSGLLPQPKFTKAYQKAWLALVEYINEDGKIIDVCAGTGQSSDINYYLTRPRITGDFHGQAPILWFAYSLIK
jgi:sialate O-acetylesterase